MPREIKDLKEFMEYVGIEAAGSGEGKSGKENVHRPKNSFKKRLTVKHNKRVTKFKLRTSKYLLTFKTSDGKIVKKILSNLPSSIEKTDIKNKRIAKKKRN